MRASEFQIGAFKTALNIITVLITLLILFVPDVFIHLKSRTSYDKNIDPRCRRRCGLMKSGGASVMRTDGRFATSAAMIST